MESNMKLHIYKGEWGLPSIDFECLQVLCAIKFTEAPIEINTKGNPLFSGSGKLPYLNDDKIKAVGSKRIIQHLETKGYSINARLSKDIQFLSDAYNTFLFNNLHPYFYYIMFGDHQNQEKTRSLYAKRTPFPFNFYYPGKLVDTTEDIIEVFGGFSIHEKIENHKSDQIILNAKQCVNMLALKLGNKKWFFGSDPSEFDANVYSYLSILYHISLPINPLQSHIRECSNLLNFINRITKDYFKTEGYRTKDYEKDNTGSSTILTQTEKDFLENKRKTQILAFLGALVAMGTYAAWTGLLQLSFKENYVQEFSYNDEDDDINSDE